MEPDIWKIDLFNLSINAATACLPEKDIMQMQILSIIALR